MLYVYIYICWTAMVCGWYERFERCTHALLNICTDAMRTTYIFVCVCVYMRRTGERRAKKQKCHFTYQIVRARAARMNECTQSSSSGWAATSGRSLVSRRRRRRRTTTATISPAARVRACVPANSTCQHALATHKTYKIYAHIDTPSAFTFYEDHPLDVVLPHHDSLSVAVRTQTARGRHQVTPVVRGPLCIFPRASVLFWAMPGVRIRARTHARTRQTPSSVCERTKQGNPESSGGVSLSTSRNACILYRVRITTICLFFCGCCVYVSVGMGEQRFRGVCFSNPGAAAAAISEFVNSGAVIVWMATHPHTPHTSHRKQTTIIIRMNATSCEWRCVSLWRRWLSAGQLFRHCTAA